MILPLIILYVVTLVYLAITERFRNFASLIGLQGWLLFAVALVRLHAINPAELAFICLETLLFKGILVPVCTFCLHHAGGAGVSGETVCALAANPERQSAQVVYFCCTFPQIALGGRYPLSLPYGARTFLTASLSASPRDCLSYSHDYFSPSGGACQRKIHCYFFRPALYYIMILHVWRKDKKP